MASVLSGISTLILVAPLNLQKWIIRVKPARKERVQEIKWVVLIYFTDFMGMKSASVFVHGSPVW